MMAEECEALAVWSTATLCRALSLENVTQISAKLVLGYSVDVYFSLRSSGVNLLRQTTC